MTFAGVKDIGILDVGKPTIFRYVNGMDIGFARDGVATGCYVVKVDYGSGEVLYGSRIARRPFPARLRAAWRVLWGGLP